MRRWSDIHRGEGVFECLRLCCKRLHPSRRSERFFHPKLCRAGVLFLLVAGVLSRLGFAEDHPLRVASILPSEKRDVPKKEPMEMPFYVFNITIAPPVKNFIPSGYMGDIPDVTMAGAYEGFRQEGYPAIKIVYTAMGSRGWAGVVWQNPDNNWGDVDGGYNLSKAKKLAFWARGKKGGEVVEFKCGGVTGAYPDSDGRSAGAVTLSSTWKQYTIDLNGADLRYIISGFGFVVKRDDNRNGCVFYMDEVKYE